jgi:hypothetical protein
LNENDLLPNVMIDPQVVEKLSVSRASGEAKLQMMKDIAAEHNVQWDPAPFEDEIRAVPDDLLVSVCSLNTSVIAQEWL